MYPRIDPGYASHYLNQNAPVRRQRDGPGPQRKSLRCFQGERAVLIDQMYHRFDSGQGSHSNYAAPKQGDEPGLQRKCLAVQKQGQWQGRRQGQDRGPGQEQAQRQGGGGGGAGAMVLFAKNSVNSLGKRCLKSSTKS